MLAWLCPADRIAVRSSEARQSRRASRLWLRVWGSRSGRGGRPEPAAISARLCLRAFSSSASVYSHSVPV